MNSQLFRRFENELQVSSKLSIEWTTRGNDFFLRPVGSETDIVWCQLNGRNLADKLDSRGHPPSVFRRLSQTWNKRSFWRFWPLENGRELALRPGFGLVRREGDEFWLRATWRRPFFASGEDVMFRRGEQLKGVETFLESVDTQFDEASELFHSMQPSWRWFCCARGDMGELQRLVGAYVTLTGAEVRFYGIGPLQLQEILYSRSGATSEERVAKWHFADRLDAHFTLRARDFALRLHDAKGLSRGKPRLVIERNGAPTMHELLEARLLLREWMTGKLSPEHLEILLSPR